LPTVVGPGPSTVVVEPASVVLRPLSVVVGLDPGTHAGRRSGSWRPTVSALLLLLALAACTHRVQVEAPKEPIVINLNVKIEQEVRVKVEQDVEDLLEENPDIF
jgi:hypothetical protein